jgi:cytochrome P450
MTTAPHRPADAAPRPRPATVPDTARIAAGVLAPLIAQGVLVRRPTAVALAERLGADRRAVRLLQRVRDRYGARVLPLRIPGRSLALVLTADDARRVLADTPDPFATDNREKTGALAHFQPDGVLISHGPQRIERRAFNEAALETDRPLHDLAGDFTTAVRAEAVPLAADAAATGHLTWDAFLPAWWRAVRRAFLGAGARDDDHLTDLLTRLRADGNWSYLHPRRATVRRAFTRRLADHLDRAEPGSLAAHAAALPTTPDTRPADQFAHWLFASEPAGMAAYRALALLAAHPEQAERARAEIAGADSAAPHTYPFLRATVLESVRLWPTTPVILRDTTAPTTWDGTELPAGTALAVLPSFLQRDDTVLPYADRFAPGVWLDGSGDASPSLLPFSAGPARCPGRDVVLQLTTALLAALLADADVGIVPPSPLRPDRPLPNTLDHFHLRFAVVPRA